MPVKLTADEHELPNPSGPGPPKAIKLANVKALKVKDGTSSTRPRYSHQLMLASHLSSVDYNSSAYLFV